MYATCMQQNFDGSINLRGLGKTRKHVCNLYATWSKHDQNMAKTIFVGQNSFGVFKTVLVFSKYKAKTCDIIVKLVSNMSPTCMQHGENMYATRWDFINFGAILWKMLWKNLTILCLDAVDKRWRH